MDTDGGNDEHEPREAAATDSGKQADSTGCLPFSSMVLAASITKAEVWG